MKPAGVVILSAEDGLGNTIRPRLEAAGADLSRIIAFRPGELPTIPNDLGALEAAIRRVRARLLIIDPLAVFLDERFNPYKDQDVRQALAPVAALAGRLGVAVLVIRHLTKTEGGPAKYRGGGSIGILGAARAALLLAHDPRDDGRRVLAPVKTNLSTKPRAIVFSFVPAGSTVRIHWHGPAPYTADQLLAELAKSRDGGKLAVAEALLRGLLEKGARAEEEVRFEAKKAGIADITLRRAREHLRVRVRRRGFGKYGEWILSLSEDPDDGSGHSEDQKARRGQKRTRLRRPKRSGRRKQ